MRMSLFLIVCPSVFFFFLCSTEYSGQTKDSLKLFVQGLAASSLAMLMIYLFRKLIPDRPGHILSLAHHWFYDYFWYFAAGAAIFSLVPSYRSTFADRPRRIASLFLGVLAPSGFATIVAVDYIRDPYYLFMLPLLRISTAILLSRVLDRTLGEFGLRLALLVAAAVALCIAPALVPFFHFWNLGLPALAVFIAILGASILLCRDAATSIFHKELRAFKDGLK
jgi:hypothetical protein